MKINHLAVIVEDIDHSLTFWRDALGLEASGTEYVDEECVQIAMLTIGDARIELVRPTTDDSGVAKYLAKKGQGMHHLCIEVANIEATMQRLAAAGIELINETPRQRDNGQRYAFVHPKSTGGVLVELYEAQD